MPRRAAHAQVTEIAAPPRLTRMTSKNQVTLHKALTDARGLPAGSLFQIEDRPEGFLLKPVVITPDPDRQAYLNAKAGKGLSPAFATADAFLADLHQKTGRKPAAVARGKRKK